ncbi:MAG: alpha-glucosidase/alpha-galactosidase, partial [Lentisphaerota bacterium]
MSKIIKIVMVGGGSYNWSPRLLCDLVQTPELEGAEVVLLDIDLKAAKNIKAAIDRVCADNGKKFSFIATSDENKAFKDCDFVIITINTGGLETMRHDLAIPRKYGIYQTVGDSPGPGGWSRMLRNVPVFEEMTRKIEKLSPRAVVLNYSNPMAGLTGAICQTSNLRAVGLCHGVMGTL